MTASLAGSIALHVGLGLALVGLVWLVGAGCLVVLGRPLDARSLLDAYPFGLLAVMAAVIPPLLWRPLGAISLVVLAWLVAAAARGVRPHRGPGLAWALLGSAAFGAGLGALLHGPTEELDSAAYGGMLWYVVKVVSATDSIVPFRDLLAEGETMIYAEAGTSFVGAALSWLPGFDPILYHAATLPTFAAASCAVGLSLFVAGTPAVSARAAAAAALLAVAVVPYATWVTETPPAAFAVPLAFSLWRLWRDELSAGWLVALSAVVAIDFFQTKVLGILAMGLLLVGAIVERNRGREDFRRLAVIGATLLAAGAAILIALLFAFASWYAGLAEPKALPLDAVRGLTDGDPDRHAIALALLVTGEVLLACVLARARAWTLLVAFAATVLLTWFVAGYGFDIALSAEIVLAALLVLAGARVDVPLALAAGALLASSVALRDALGAQPGLALALTLVVALGAVVARTRARRVVATAGAAVAALAVVNGFDLADAPVAVTRDDRDVWRVVHERVPDDALVFTSLTGLDVTPHRGWNNYPAIAERQIFVAGWYDGRLVSHPEDRDRKLAESRAVLSGRSRPDGVSLSREYDAYYAVTQIGEDVPSTFRRLYRNSAYALYEIP